jgi:DNA replication initiation complex subunit (GINS family)
MDAAPGGRSVAHGLGDRPEVTPAKRSVTLPYLRQGTKLYGAAAPHDFASQSAHRVRGFLTSGYASILRSPKTRF